MFTMKFESNSLENIHLLQTWNSNSFHVLHTWNLTVTHSNAWCSWLNHKPRITILFDIDVRDNFFIIISRYLFCLKPVIQITKNWRKTSIGVLLFNYISHVNHSIQESYLWSYTQVSQLQIKSSKWRCSLVGFLWFLLV